LFEVGASRQGHGHASLAGDVGFAKQADLRVGLREDLAEISELNVVGIALDEDCAGS
jgi:hypothetical protein